MFAASMAVFAFVIAAAGLVVLALLISRLSALGKGWDYRLGILEEKTTMALQLANEKSNATLKAEVDALAGALDAMRTGNRREFGSLWGRLGGRTSDRDALPTVQTGDNDFDAVIALQSATPVKPQ